MKARNDWGLILAAALGALLLSTLALWLMGRLVPSWLGFN